MGHDLVTIYWIKAAEYLLAIVSVPLFFAFWKFTSPPATRHTRAAERNGTGRHVPPEGDGAQGARH